MSKRNKLIYWIATIWLSLGMLSTGMVQLFQIKEEMDFIIQLGYPGYFIMLLGICKIIGVVVVLIPGSLVLKEWAYAGFFFMMSGAVVSHIAAGNPVNEIFPSLLLLALTMTSWYFRPMNRKMTAVTSTGPSFN